MTQPRVQRPLRWNVWCDWRRWLVYTHRWLGIAGGLLFAVWFVSGIVLMYAGMPELTESKRLQRLPVLDLSLVSVAPGAAAAVVGASPSEMVVAMVGSRPVYRFPHAGRWTTVYADTGELFAGLTTEEAVAVAKRFGRDPAVTVEYDRLLTGPDQWTLQAASYRPLHRVTLRDENGTEVYVSNRTGQPMLETTSSTRGWAYAGAVLHWLYFTPFRQHGDVWLYSLIWLSILGCFGTLTGLVWGIWRLSPRHRYRLRLEGRSVTPYSGLMKWHHYSGLVFGLVTFTWILSGCLSLEPFAWHPGTAPTPEQEAAVVGAPFRLDAVSVDALRQSAAQLGASVAARELEIVQFRGRLYLIGQDVETGRQRLISIQRPSDGVRERFAAEDVLEAGHRAMPRASVVDAVWLQEYDAYYYDRSNTRRLPVLRVRYDDAAQTWLYLDPFRGAIVRKEVLLTRINRWLYHGLHSLDFPFLYYQRPLWDVVVIVLSLGGLVLSVTTLLPAWRRLRRHGRRPQRYSAARSRR